MLILMFCSPFVLFFLSSFHCQTICSAFSMCEVPSSKCSRLYVLMHYTFVSVSNCCATTCRLCTTHVYYPTNSVGQKPGHSLSGDDGVPSLKCAYHTFQRGTSPSNFSLGTTYSARRPLQASLSAPKELLQLPLQSWQDTGISSSSKYRSGSSLWQCDS